MTPRGIIAKKRDNQKLTPREMEYFIGAYVNGDLPDYQMAALLMAIFLNGMDAEETAWLTEVMLKSGKIVSFPGPERIYVDKHSTGGVGDKVSLILAPLVASCGAKVPMLSGRGLGHTGGTLDKIESIPGFRTDLSISEFEDMVKIVGCVISGQTSRIAPADGMIYALRHSTATVESIPLICASILSKKCAAGPGSLVFDVKCGNGAFMETLEHAERLANALLDAGRAMGKKVAALITDMNQPLGYTAGNILEVKEAIEALLGRISPDLREITLALGAEMLLLSGISKDRDEALSLLEKRLEDGSAFSKFEEMVARQGGDLSIFSYPSRIPKAPVIGSFASPAEGYIQGFDTAGLGDLIVEMGGGRKAKDDAINPLVGMNFLKKTGSTVSKGEEVIEIHAESKDRLEEARTRLASLIRIGPERIEPPPLIRKRIA